MRIEITTCFFFLLTSSYGLCQQQIQKPLLNQASLDLLTTGICECLTEKIKTSADVQGHITSCYNDVFAKHTATILADNGLEDNREVGIQIGQLIVEVLQKDCPAFMDARKNTPGQQLIDKAETLRGEGKWEESINLFSKLINRNIFLVDKTVFNNRGLCKMELQDNYGALADFEFAVQRDTAYAISYSNRGFAKSKIGDANGAYADYTYAISLDSTQATFFNNRGILLYEAENFDEADADLKKATSLDSASAVGYYYRGLIGLSQEKFSDTTASYFNKAIKLDPENHIYRNNRGLFMWEKKDYKLARADFLAVIKQQPDYNPAYYNLAMLSVEENQFDDGLRYINEAIKIKSDLAFYHNSRAKILLAKASYKEALASTDKAIELDAKKAEFYDRRGEICEKMGNIAQAAEAYTKSIELYERDGVIYYRRGLMRLKLKDVSGACEDFSMGKLFKNQEAAKAVSVHCTK